MAKRASVLDADYNPVGSRLQRVLQPETNQAIKPTQEDDADVNLDSPECASVYPSFKPIAQKKSLENKTDVSAADREMMSCQIRLRCTDLERRKWQEFSYRLTGETNTFSHILRALLILLEQAEGEFGKVSELARALTKPPKSNSLQVALYEQKLAQVFWETIRRSGRLERRSV
jgi:hypothetical protein